MHERITATTPSQAVRSQGTGSDAGGSLAHRLLGLQRAVGNRAVTHLVQRDPAPAGAASAAPAAGATAPAPVPSTTTDNEGNTVDPTGRPHLAALPADRSHQVFSRNPLPAALPPNPLAAFTALRTQVQVAAAEQLIMATGLRGDMKYWFARVYQHVTQHILETVDAGAYVYPLAVLAEAVAFHATYRANLDAWRSNHHDQVEHNWRVAFAEAESVNDGSWYRFRSQEILNALLPSMEAHIRFDLPRAIAAVYEQNYAGIPGVTLDTFHGDFDRMGPVFDAATVDIQTEIDAECWGFDPGDWHWAEDLGFPFLFGIATERQHAWEKAGAIVRGHGQGITTRAGMQNRVRGEMTARHPMRSDPVTGNDDFAISTSWGRGRATQEEVDDYDWNHQPH